MEAIVPESIVEWMQNTGLGWRNIWTAALVFILFIVLRTIFTKYIFQLIISLTSKTRTRMDSDIALAFEKPVRVLFIVAGTYLALRALNYDPAAHAAVSSLFRSVLVLLVTWGLLNLTSASSHWIEGLGERFNIRLDRILIPLISKFIRFIVLALAISVIVQEWGYEISGFIAGLGLGGLAFALAAQEALTNIVGGVVIITEKPFSIGDWIETPSVEGTVEDITFRSTRIRTFAQALVTVPNAKLASEAITNWSRMGKRRITFRMGVSHTTPRHKLDVSVRRIRSMLKNHPEIHQETLFVHFDEITPNSLQIYLYFFTNTIVWGEWLRVKEDCNMKILEILEQEGVSIALPSTSVYFETALAGHVVAPDSQDPYA